MLKSAIPIISIYFVLMIGIYWDPLKMMIHQWGRDDYNYCYLIPFIVAYLVWEKRRDFCGRLSAPSWIGMIPVAAGILLYFLGELGGEFYTLFISSWLMLIGLCWLHLGWSKLKVLGFPCIILLTMFPFPNLIHFNASLRLQLISSQFGTALMRLYGLTAYRDGNVIDLGFTQLQIVEACSGLRYIIPLLVIGLILVYFFKASWWKRLLLLASTVPWAIVVNSFRIAITGVLASILGMGAIEGFSHDFAGWVVFMVSLGVLLGEMWILARIGPRSASAPVVPPPAKPLHSSPLAQAGSEQVAVAAAPENGEAIATLNRDQKNGRGHGAETSISSWLPKAVLATLILALMFGLSYAVEFRERIPAKRSLIQFPLEIEEWRGNAQFMNDEILGFLHLSDYVMIAYRNPGGRIVDLYVAYYESQRKGISVHSPDTCLPGAGWVFEKAELISFPTPGEYGGMITVNRAFMSKRNMRQLVYYWFPQRGRILHHLIALKLYAFWDALTRQRTDGAMVRLVTPLTELEPHEQADQRLQQFTRQILPLLAEYLPGR